MSIFVPRHCLFKEFWCQFSASFSSSNSLSVPSVPLTHSSNMLPGRARTIIKYSNGRFVINCFVNDSCNTHLQCKLRIRSNFWSIIYHFPNNVKAPHFMNTFNEIPGGLWFWKFHSVLDANTVVSLRARHRANWPAVKMALPGCFQHSGALEFTIFKALHKLCLGAKSICPEVAHVTLNVCTLKTMKNK